MIPHILVGSLTKNPELLQLKGKWNWLKEKQYENSIQTRPDCSLIKRIREELVNQKALGMENSTFHMFKLYLHCRKSLSGEVTIRDQ